MAHKPGTQDPQSAVPRLPEHLQRRDGNFYFRMRVPDELRGALGKREFHQTLKTTNLDEAKRRVAVARFKAIGELDEVRKNLNVDATRTSDVLSEHQLWSLAVRWLVEKLGQDARLSAADIQASARLEELSYVTDLDDTNNLAAAFYFTKKLLAAQKIDLAPESEDFGRLSNLIHEAMIEREKRIARRFGRAAGVQLNPDFETVTGAGSHNPRADIALADLIVRFETDLAKEPGVLSTRLRRAAHFKFLTEILGAQTLVRKIDRVAARRVLDAVTKLPANVRKHFAGMQLGEVLALPPSKLRAPMNPVTANGYLIAFSSLMEFAVNEHLIERNPAKGLRVPSDGISPKDKRRPFSIEDLNRVFSAPLYRGCIDDGAGYAKAGSNRPKGGRYWVPIIGLFTGMRLNEICQLTTDDIASYAGVEVFLVRASDDGSKRLKSDAAARLIPVHPELKRLGFLQYVNRSTSLGGRLFPDLSIAKSGYASDNFSKWFAHFLDHIGITDKRKTFHSLRHNFRDAMRVANIPAERMKQLGGWSSGEVPDNYGNEPRIVALCLAEEIVKIKYDGLCLDYL